MPQPPAGEAGTLIYATSTWGRVFLGIYGVVIGIPFGLVMVYAGLYELALLFQAVGLEWLASGLLRFLFFGDEAFVRQGVRAASTAGWELLVVPPFGFWLGGLLIKHGLAGVLNLVLPHRLVEGEVEGLHTDPHHVRNRRRHVVLNGRTFSYGSMLAPALDMAPGDVVRVELPGIGDSELLRLWMVHKADRAKRRPGASATRGVDARTASGRSSSPSAPQDAADEETFVYKELLERLESVDLGLRWSPEDSAERLQDVFELLDEHASDLETEDRTRAREQLDALVRLRQIAQAAGPYDDDADEDDPAVAVPDDVTIHVLDGSRIAEEDEEIRQLVATIAAHTRHLASRAEREDARNRQLQSEGKGAHGGRWSLRFFASVASLFVVIPGLFWLAYDEVPGLAWGVAGFFALLAIALEFGLSHAPDTSRPSRATTPHKSSPLDALAVMWLLAIPFGPVAGWIATEAIGVTADNWKLLLGFRAAVCVAVPLIGALSLVRFIRPPNALAATAVVVVGTAFPVVFGVDAVRDLIEGARVEQVEVTRIEDIHRVDADGPDFVVRGAYVHLADGRRLTRAEDVEVQVGATELLILPHFGRIIGRRQATVAEPAPG